MKKICTRCKKKKELSEFCRCKDNLDGLHRWCRNCNLKYSREYRKTKKGREAIQKSGRTKTRRRSKRDYNFRTKYNITMDDYDKLFDLQQGVCAICKKPETRMGKWGNVYHLVVDHNHETGEVRGLLCSRCNTAVAAFDVDTDGKRLLLNAIKHIS